MTHCPAKAAAKQAKEVPAPKRKSPLLKVRARQSKPRSCSRVKKGIACSRTCSKNMIIITKLLKEFPVQPSFIKELNRIRLLFFLTSKSNHKIDLWLCAMGSCGRKAD